MKTGMKIFIGLAAIAAIMGGFLLKKSSDKKKAAKAKQLADEAAADAAAKAADTEKKRIDALKAKAASDKAKADLVKANTAANQAAAAAAAKAEADAKAAHDKAVAEQAAADAAAAQAQAAADAIMAKLKGIVDAVNQTGIFPSLSDAQYLMDNLGNLSVPPNTATIKNALKRSNMAFYDGKVTPRMTRDEVSSVLASYAPKATAWTPPYYGIGFKGGYDSPNFDNIPIYQLKKIYAHGWWFGLEKNANGNSAPTAGTRGVTNNYVTLLINGSLAYVVKPFDRLQGETLLSMLAMPASVKEGNDYFLEFSGKAKAWSKYSDFVNEPSDLN